MKETKEEDKDCGDQINIVGDVPVVLTMDSFFHSSDKHLRLSAPLLFH